MTNAPMDRPRVVATPGTMSGQPRIDGTRMTVAQLLVYMRGGMTVEEISAEWPHLPAGWWDAIIEWIDRQAAPGLDASSDGYGPEALEVLKTMEPPRRRSDAAITEALDDGKPDARSADGRAWRLIRDPGETDDEYARRRALFRAVEIEHLPDESDRDYMIRRADIVRILIARSQNEVDGGHDADDVMAELSEIIEGPPPVWQGRTIRGGELVRRPDETDEEWAASLARHEISRRIGQQFILHMTIDSAVSAICDVEEPTPGHLREVADVANDVLRALLSSSRREELAAAYRDLSERVLEARREIARASGEWASVTEEQLLKGLGDKLATATVQTDAPYNLADLPAVTEQQVSTRYYSISFPLIPGDEQMSDEAIRAKYALIEALARLRGGITPTQMSDLGLDEAWEVISTWVDGQRARR